MALNMNWKEFQRAYVMDLLSSLRQDENTQSSRFLTDIFGVLRHRPSEMTLQTAAQVHVLHWEDILVVAQSYRDGRLEEVMQCVQHMYGSEFWRCVNHASYDLMYPLLDLVERASGHEAAIVMLLSSPDLDLYKLNSVGVGSKPLLHLLMSRLSRTIWSWSCEDDAGRKQRCTQVLLTIVNRCDFDPDAEDGFGNTAARMILKADCCQDKARRMLAEFVAHNGVGGVRA